MSLFRIFSTRLTIVMTLAVILAAGIPAASVSAASSAQIKEAQEIGMKFDLPIGPIDGMNGPLTERGLCVFRQLSGLTVSRKPLDSSTLDKMRAFDKKYDSLSEIPVRENTVDGSDTYLIAHKTCQTMVYAEDGNYKAVTPITTGMKGYRTPKGTYKLGGTQRGWHCSTAYPESCSVHSEGRFARHNERTGNMYNQRSITGDIFLHGSTDIHTYPASHGCIRIPIAFSDWMYDHVDANIPIKITGNYPKGK